METRSREIAGVGNSPTEQIDFLKKPQERGRSPFQKIQKVIDRLSTLPPTLATGGRWLLLASLITVAVAAEKAGVVGADTPSPSRTTAEWMIQDAEAVFADLKKEQSELEKNPDIVYGIFLEKDADDNVRGIYAIGEGWNTDANGNRIPIGPGWKSQRYLYKSSLNEQTGKFSRFEVISPKLPIRATSVAVSGQKILIGGSMVDTLQNYAAAILYEDGGKTFNNMGFPALTQAGLTEIALVPGTNAALLSFGGFEVEGSLKLFNFDTKKVVDVSLPSGWTTGQGLSIASTGDGGMRVLSSALTSNHIDRGYVDIAMDPLTGRVDSAQIKHPEINYAAGFCATKDKSGAFDKIYAASFDRYWHVIDVKTDQAAEPVSFAGWLNSRNIPGYSNDSLWLQSVRIKRTTVWAAGGIQGTDGEPRAVVLSWPLDTDPGSRPDLLTLYRLLDSPNSAVAKDNSFQFGIFGDKPGFLANISNRGFAFEEIAADGKPIPGVLPFYIGRGLSELPSPPASTKTTIKLPVLFKNASIR